MAQDLTTSSKSDRLLTETSCPTVHAERSTILSPPMGEGDPKSQLTAPLLKCTDYSALLWFLNTLIRQDILLGELAVIAGCRLASDTRVKLRQSGHTP
ncbi:hypothetical protein J6590_082181 [Homalodisca vitripennis]|nr:hypothetical protein J6590_082181 [Homalodisca vitripennis]